MICKQRRSRAAATSKMERFLIIVNGWKLLTIITKRSILDVAAAVEPPLVNLTSGIYSVRNLLRFFLRVKYLKINLLLFLE